MCALHVVPEGERLIFTLTTLKCHLQPFHKKVTKYAGQVKSDCLTCTFRASRCIARLSRAQMLLFACSSVRDRKYKYAEG